MEGCKLLAFLLCEEATAASDGKVTLHGLFDRIIVPRGPTNPKLFFVYYKIVVEEPCVVTLRIIALDRFHADIPGSWQDAITQVGPVQSIWALTSSLFEVPGRYVLELRQEIQNSEPLSLASMVFVVQQQEVRSS